MSIRSSTDSLPTPSLTPPPSPAPPTPPYGTDAYFFHIMPAAQPPDEGQWVAFWDWLLHRNQSPLAPAPPISPPATLSQPPPNGGKPLTGRVRLISSAE